jgi:signal transduction histidine kinase
MSRFLSVRLPAWTIRSQLVFGIALVHAVLMTIFVVDLVQRQRSFLYRQQVEHTTSLIEGVARNGTSAVLASDVSGLQELLRPWSGYPDLRYIFITDIDGRVLAHSDPRWIGRYTDDSISVRLLDAPVRTQVLLDNSYVIDVAAPILNEGRLIGWARVGIGRDLSASGLDAVTRRGILYILIAIVIGVLVALLLARTLTRGIYQLLEVADSTGTGRRDLRAAIAGPRELARLADSFNRMLDALVSNERALRISSDHLAHLNAELEQRVTERTQELRAANERLTEVDRLKSEFLATMSHELRTPLNAILGFSAIMRDGVTGELSAEQREYLDLINQSGEHLLALVNDVLDLSKIESGHMTLDMEAGDIVVLAESTLAALAERARARRVRLRFEKACAMGPLLLDSRKVRQILLNLLSNAVKFTEEQGAVTLSINKLPAAAVREAIAHASDDTRVFPLRGASSDDYLELAVSDTGIGIAAQDLKRLFEPFTQVDSSLSRRHEGTGLGLMMVLRLTELHGGALMVTSVRGRGSRFVVWLPWREGVPASACREVISIG